MATFPFKQNILFAQHKFSFNMVQIMQLMPFITYLELNYMYFKLLVLYSFTYKQNTVGNSILTLLQTLLEQR